MDVKETKLINAYDLSKHTNTNEPYYN